MGSDLGEITEVARADDSSLGKIADRNGDAFAELYRRHLCAVFGFIKSQTPDVSTAEDLTAQVFFKALRSASTFNGSGSYSSWLYQIARNCVSSWHRTRGRDVPVRDLPEPVDPEPSPATRLVDEESRSTVWAALKELPPSQRDAVVLRYMNDLSIEEIATILDRTPGAVRILLHRARNNLRKGYERKVG
jgi:RNA polymerase sigma-70 factor (ECF subfamily)